MPGCDPSTWPVVVEDHESRRLLLDSMTDGAPSEVIDIGRVRDADENSALLKIGEHWLGSHGSVRKKEPAYGCMSQVGDHVAPDGHWRPEACAAGERRMVASGMERAGRVFGRYFSRRAVGWAEMLAVQAALWPKGSPWWPQQWSVSRGLGNAEHADRDEVRCFAVWLSADHPGPIQSWWLLFPPWGIAIRLCHGTRISWHGRLMPHCTTVPAANEGSGLVSLFCGLQAKACAMLAREIACSEELRDRSAESVVGGVANERGRALFDRLQCGMLVSVKCALLLKLERVALQGISKRALERWGSCHARWAAATVVRVEGGVGGPFVVVRVASGKLWWLSVSDVSNRLVIGQYKCE